MNSFKMVKWFLLFCFLFDSCVSPREATCEEAAESVRPDSCNIVISEFSKNEYKFFISGINPNTNQKEDFSRVNYTWGYWFVNKIAKGDTIVKKEGELNFYIHKKDTTLVFPFECKGEFYK